MRILIFFFCATVLFACNNKKPAEGNAPAAAAAEPADSTNFFPVTTFLKGDIADIKNIGIAPVRKTIINGHTDSTYVKPEQYDSVFADFLSPRIDTANLKGMFSEKKFLDQTINAFTFSYDPIGNKANDFAFTHWDVYVDPETSKVKRIYMVKKNGPDQQLQLTWKTGKSCRIVTVNTGANSGVVKEVTVSWTYDNQ